MCKESGRDAEVDSASDESRDARIIDVTSEFIGSQGILDISTHEGSSDAECCSGAEPVPDAACGPEADAEVRGLDEAVASIRVQDDLAAASSPDVEVAVVLGGMDTGGEIFDDCLVLRLTTSI